MANILFALASVLVFSSNPTPTSAKSAAPQWALTREFSMEWQGQPYLPVGIRTSPSSSLFDYALSKGISDYVLDLPLNSKVWNDATEKLGNRQFIASINSLSPFATGTTVQPQWYRIPGITKNRTMKVALPGAESALVVLAIRRDATIVSSDRVKVVDGVANITLKAMPNADQIALIYPVGESTENEDLWEGFDHHRDTLIKTLQNFKGKKNLRGLLNPLGQVPKLDSKELTFVSSSPIFRLELAQYLEERYKSVKTLSVAWAIGTNDLEKFDDFARLVPLWTSTRGVGRLYDVDKNRMYQADQKKSVIWNDIKQVVATTRRRRIQRLVEMVHKISDVPVVQEWSGWSALYENPDTTLDGLGMRLESVAASSVAETGARTLSSLTRWNKPGWFVGSDIVVPSKADLDGLIEDLTNLGVRGAFFRPKSQGEIDTLVGRTFTGPFARPDVLYFPENASNPAYPQKLGGKTWWVPTPVPGNRYDFGSGLFGYQYELNGQTQYVMWTDGARRRVTLITPKPAEAKVFPNGSINPEPVATSKGLDVTLSGIPTTFANVGEMPVPDVALETESKRYADFIARAQKIRRDVADEIYDGKDLKDSIKKSPSRAFDLLQKLNKRLYLILSNLSWIEAESIPNHTFSEVVTDPGCSGSATLTLRTPFSTETGVNTARFNVNMLTQSPQEVWIAAKISESDRDLLSLKFGNQVLKISGVPVSKYGSGYGWYKLGETRFLASKNEWLLEVESRDGLDMAIDAIVFAPPGFAPRGPSIPSLFLPALPVAPSAKPTKKGSGG